MTSQESSNKVFSHKTVTAFSFVSAFGVGLFLINAATLFVLLLPLPSVEALSVVRMNNPDTVYCLIPPNRPSSLFMFVVIVQAMAVSIMLFGFMLNKRTATAYLSLPINRARLFLTRYAAGLIISALPWIIYMTWNFTVNLRVFGYTSVLMQGFLIYTIGILISLFTVYSITTAVCLHVGTITEGLVYSIAVMFGVTLIALGLNILSRSFLPGNAFGETIGLYQRAAPNLESYVMPYLPAMSIFSYIDIYKQITFQIADLNVEFVPFYNFWHGRIMGTSLLLIWLSVSSLISFLAFRGFKRYRAEDSGVHGNNKAFGFYVTFIAVLIAFSIFFDAGNLTIPEKILYALISSLITYIVFQFLVTLSINKALRGFWQYGAMLAGITAAIVCCLTGMFGYSLYQPNLDEIESVSITYTGAPDYILGTGGETGNFYVRSNNAAEQDICVRSFDDMLHTSESDIMTVMELHKELIDAGLDFSAGGRQTIDDIDKDRLAAKIIVQYNLKAGNTATRLYKSVPARIAADMLRLEDTDLIGVLTNESLDIPAGFKELRPIQITDSLFVSQYTLDPDDNKDLFAALRKDINKLSSDEKYYPNHKAFAVISFPRISTDDETGLSYISYPGEDYSLNNRGSDATYYPFNNSTNNIRLFITEGFVNTIEFLKQKGIYDEINTSVPGTSEIVEMYVERYRINPDFDTLPLYFRSYASGLYSRRDISPKVDQSEYQSILDASRNSYYVAEGGYLVYVLTKTESGSDKWTTLFIPQGDTPEYVAGRF